LLQFGRTSTELLGAHLTQLSRLPSPCAVGLDESSNKVENKLFEDKEGSTIIDNFARFFNHFTGDNSLLVFMEQNSGRAYKGYRDSVCLIKNQKGVRVHLEPTRLLKRLDKYFAKLDKLNELPSYDLATRVLRLYKRTKRIGVLELNYTLLGNRDTTNETLSDGVKQGYLPLPLPFSYDNRFFRTGYLCRNDDITLSRFKGDLQNEKQVEDIIRISEIVVGETKTGKEITKKTVTLRGQDIKERWREKKGLSPPPPPIPPPESD
jgi:hypothetical protein